MPTTIVPCNTHPTYSSAEERLSWQAKHELPLAGVTHPFHHVQYEMVPTITNGTLQINSTASPLATRHGRTFDSTALAPFLQSVMCTKSLQLSGTEIPSLVVASTLTESAAIVVLRRIPVTERLTVLPMTVSTWIGYPYGVKTMFHSDN